MEAPSVFWEDVELGRELLGAEQIADHDEMVAFAERFDPWPMHLSDEGGAASPFGGLIASGGYTIGLWYRSGHGIWHRPGAVWAFQGVFDWHVRFVQPLRPGDRVRLAMTFTNKRLTSKPGRGIAEAESHLVDGEGEPVLGLDVKAMFGTRPG